MNTDSSGVKIPSLLVGKATPVRKRLRSMLKRVFKEGTWANVAAELDYIDIADAPGRIQIHGPMNLLPGENIVVWLIMEEIWRFNRVASDYHQIKMILLEGLDYFWFALALHSQNVFLPFVDVRQAERPTVARIALPKFLRWWDTFYSLEPRYSLGVLGPVYWPEWGALVRILCRDLGVDQRALDILRSVDAVAAKRVIENWLAAS
jgi:hypothetical protein